MSIVLNLNRANLSDAPISTSINALIEAAEPAEKGFRQYLGASIVGSECLRKIQYDWLVAPQYDSQTKDIFRRGHLFEELTRQHLIRAGFKFAPDSKLGFSAVSGRLQGHADGIMVGGPSLPGVGYPCVWECKCLGDKGWKDLERDGLEKKYPQYAAQILLYQAYLDVTNNPAVFTAVNANTCARLHLLFHFNTERAQELSDRAVTVIRATIAGELLARGYDKPDDWRCRFCSHHKRCWA